MNKTRITKISAALLIVFATTLLLSSIPPATGAPADEPPMNAGEAIDAILSRDPEMFNLKLREGFAFNRIDGLVRSNLINPFYGIINNGNLNSPAAGSNDGLSIAELTSELHDLWAKMDMRSNSAIVDMLTVIITIDIQMIRQRELTSMHDDLTEWIKTAETDYRTSKIEIDILNNLKDSLDQVKRNLTATNLRLGAQQKRFRELTGHYIPEDFDFESAWLLVDAEKIDDEISYSPRPHTFFRELFGLIPPPKEVTLASTALSEARIALISLHEALLAYEKNDQVVQQMEEHFKTGEVDKYTLFDATSGLALSGLAVYDAKYGYALSIYELDKLTGGVISSEYSENKAQWYSDMESVFEGRYNVKYPWMRHISGEWILSGAQGEEEKVTLNIIKPWDGPGDPSSIKLYYNDKLLGEGEPTGSFTFTMPKYERSRLIEVRYYNDAGTEIYRVYLDGFVNAGRFFWLDDSGIYTDEMKLGTPIPVDNRSAGLLQWDPVRNNGFLSTYEITVKGEYWLSGNESDPVSGTIPAEIINGSSFDYVSYLSAKFPAHTYPVSYRLEVTVKALSNDLTRCEDSDESAVIIVRYRLPQPPPPPPPPAPVCICDQESICNGGSNPCDPNCQCGNPACNPNP